MWPARAPWYVVPLATAAVVGTAAAVVSVSNRNELRRRAATRAARDAAALLHAVTELSVPDCATDASASSPTEPLTQIWLNTHQCCLTVPVPKLRAFGHNLYSLLDCYAIACRCRGVSDAERADLWNTLCAVVEAHLATYVEATPLSADTDGAATALALFETLRSRRYHITGFLSSCAASSRLKLHTPQEGLFRRATRKNRRGRGAGASLTVFARLVHQTCTVPEKALLGILAVANLTHVTRLLFLSSPLVVPPALLYTVGALGEAGGAESVPWHTFVCHVVAESPGRLLAAAALSSLAVHLLTSAKDAASDAALRRFRAAVKANTLLALARFDFVADAWWPLPGRVYAALGVATNFSFADADRALSAAGERVRRWRTVLQLPVPCAVGWLARQGLDWLQRSWTKACAMTAFVGGYAEGGSAHAGASQLGCAAHRAVCAPAVALPAYRTHYGLLALTATLPSPSPVALFIARHIRWPLEPRVCLLASEEALGVVASAASDDALLAKHGAVQELCAPLGDDEAAASAVPFVAALAQRRVCGDDGAWLGRRTGGLQSGDFVALDGGAVEETLDRTLACCHGIPVMAALAAEARGSPRLRSGGVDAPTDAVTAAYDVARVVDSDAVFVAPPVQHWCRVSSFQLDAQTARLGYCDHATVAQSVAALLHVQHGHQPAIDGRSWGSYSQPLPPPLAGTGAWRITFDRVFFRYPGTDRDVLQDISFDLPAGGLLGIVGYSGAGKSTLLLLLSRVYAPTRGQIRINGCPIECLAPRALRRRLGNSWQGDDETCFLEGLAVERNLAYGDLGTASGERVRAALVGACITAAVDARPAGAQTALRCGEWSGGEVARLRLARALMRPRSVAGAYVFDECANGLDSVTEAAIFGGGADRWGGSTRVIVSHRLASVYEADEILVLAGGRVAERGSWAELLRGPETSLFKSLYRAQTV